MEADLVPLYHLSKKSIKNKTKNVIIFHYLAPNNFHGSQPQKHSKRNKKEELFSGNSPLTVRCMLQEPNQLRGWANDRQVAALLGVINDGMRGDHGRIRWHLPKAYHVPGGVHETQLLFTFLKCTNDITRLLISEYISSISHDREYEWAALPY